MKANGVASMKKTPDEVLRKTMDQDTVDCCFAVKHPFALVSTNLEEES